ncbi:MAG: hypothetical protein BAJALOKI3v1_440001 [Promethearchaeota archaeon]|nr:MAG: hypothetical protein BAJALOKI3v1_440001 [Candidatus Lokiarchaeota archaeon]
MKKKRVIKLKDPRLRKIRKNLRELLLKAFSRKLNEILDKQDKIRENPDLNYYEKQEKQIELESIIQDLKLARNGAPLSCSTCSRIDIDLVYNPVFEEWYCEECYEFNSQGHKDWFP